MNRRQFISNLSGLLLAGSLPAFTKEVAAVAPLTKSKSAWKALLPPDRYGVLFEEDTERSGSTPSIMKSAKALSFARHVTYHCSNLARNSIAVLAGPVLGFVAKCRWHQARLQVNFTKNRISLRTLWRSSGTYL